MSAERVERNERAFPRSPARDFPTGLAAPMVRRSPAGYPVSVGLVGWRERHDGERAFEGSIQGGYRMHWSRITPVAGWFGLVALVVLAGSPALAEAPKNGGWLNLRLREDLPQGFAIHETA